MEQITAYETMATLQHRAGEVDTARQAELDRAAHAADLRRGMDHLLDKLHKALAEERAARFDALEELAALKAQIAKERAA